MTDRHSLPWHRARVILSRLLAADLDAFQAYRHDEEVGRYQGCEPWSATKALTFLEAMSTVDLLDPGTWCKIGIATRNRSHSTGD